MSLSVCEEKVYHEIFVEHATNLRNFIYYKCGDLNRAEDITQDSFVKLWQNCSKVIYDKVRSYLYTIAMNQFRNEIEHQKVVLKFESRQTKRHDSENPQHLLEQEEFRQRLEAAISDLPESQRTVFLMNRIDKKKYREIAEELGVSVKTIEKRMHQALNQLRKIHKKI